MTVDEKINALAEEALSITRAKLLLHMRFLAKAVNHLPSKPFGAEISSDGRAFMYEPRALLKIYRENENALLHGYLHVLMHCIFRHWRIGTGVEELKWNTACDIAAEAVIKPFGAQFFESSAEKERIIKLLSAEIRPLTAEKIYAFFEKNNVDEDTLEKYRKAFYVDKHIYPFRTDAILEPEDQLPTIGISDGAEKDNENKNENSPDDSGDETTADDTEQNARELEKAPQNAADDRLAEFERQRAIDEMNALEKFWEDISKKISADLESFSKNYGEAGEHLVQAIADVNRDRCDYSAFLKKFAVSGEVMRIDDESFDLNYYSYSLSLYKNVPLIEPYESKETKLVRDFVIALDTSGSVRGELVEAFVRKTYSILKSEESFFTKVNIYLIQCDSEIKEAVRLESSDGFEKYIRKMEIKGLGGTDFRPVFEYVDELIACGALTRLKGLVYFTDGFGKFPAKPPKYRAAFAFLRSDYEKYTDVQLPPWAIKLILEEDDIYDDR